MPPTVSPTAASRRRDSRFSIVAGRDTPRAEIFADMQTSTSANERDALWTAQTNAVALSEIYGVRFKGNARNGQGGIRETTHTSGNLSAASREVRGIAASLP